MRLTYSKSKNITLLYVIKDYTYNHKRSTKVVEKLGTIEEIAIRANGADPIVWVNQYIEELNTAEKLENSQICIRLSESKTRIKNKQIVFNGGYLFLQDIYYKLGLHTICNEIKKKYKFKYDLNNVLSRLVYSRIIYPSSKVKTMELSKNFIEQPNFNLHDIYRSLEVIFKESDYIQSELYKNTLKYSKRNDTILYYDCTNYFFEIEDPVDDKQNGVSKENKPLPIIQMGLFLDGDGIPLAFDMSPGNTNEQITLKPLEERIIKDFNKSEFVVCTDAGLASMSNRKFNNIHNRKFITTQPIKKLKKFLKDDAIDMSKGWKLAGSNKVYDIRKLKDDEKLIRIHYDSIFYKERWIKEDGLEQRLIVTFSVKYQEYKKRLRNNQVNRALKLIETHPTKISKPKQNDMKRFIKTTTTTSTGEVASENHYEIDDSLILEESKYDGFYAVCTNLDNNISDILRINRNRWEIEESFRIMKSEFKARPVYLSNKQRIRAHFTTCFLALVLYRYLEKRLDESLTVSENLKFLKEYNFKELTGFGFEPLYISNDQSDFIHEKFGFNTDKEYVSNKGMKKIFQKTKN